MEGGGWRWEGGRLVRLVRLVRSEVSEVSEE